jgi:hypothetical protein
VFILTAAFAPSANAASITYWNFNDAVEGGPPDLLSDAPGEMVGQMLINNYNPANYRASVGLPENIVVGDPEPAGLGLGLSRSSGNDPAQFDIVLTSTGVFQDMSLSFAINSLGNGFENVNFQHSLDGVTFTTYASFVIEEGPTQIFSAAVPAAVNNQPFIVLRLEFTGGQSMGNDLQNVIDNIQLNGTIIPEPATVVGGLLGVCGLCWHQRRRLIRSVRFRRA